MTGPQFEISRMPSQWQLARMAVSMWWKHGGKLTIGLPVFPYPRVVVIIEITRKRKIRAPGLHAWNCCCKQCGWAGMPHD